VIWKPKYTHALLFFVSFNIVVEEHNWMLRNLILEIGGPEP
jgi:hypothetical protein